MKRYYIMNYKVCTTFVETDGRTYITSMTPYNVSEVLEAGFVPCDPISGKKKTGLSNEDIYDLWSEGDITLCKEAVID